MAADGRRTRGVLLRVLLGVLAALALLGSGPVVLAPTSAEHTERRASSPAVPQDAMQGSATTVLLRAGGLAGAPAPTSPGGGLLPRPGPALAPHLVPEAPARGPAAQPVGASVLAAGSRAPPAPAGT